MIRSLCCSLFATCLLHNASAQDDALQKTTTVAGDMATTGVWFQDIQAPLEITDAEAMALCQAVYSGLQRGVTPDTAIGSLPGADRPRAFFLSWSDGKISARTRVGIGASAAAALQDVCRQVSESKPSPRNMVWLKLDIVQHGEAVTNFSPRTSRLPLPSLVGLTFGPGVGFEFLPEHLVAWEMVNPLNEINVHYISERVIGQEHGRYLSDQEQLAEIGRWTVLSNYTGGQKVCLFETQSYFQDGAGCIPLFRGHPLYSNLSAEELRGAARAAGDRLVEYGTDLGLFVCTLPEWELDKPQIAEPWDYAAALLALVRLHQATGEARYLKTAERVAACLAAGVETYGGTPTAGCLPESAHVDSAAGVLARREFADANAEALARPRLTMTATNALAVTALCEFSTAAKSTTYHGALAMLAQHLVLQLQPDGSVVEAREFPSLRLATVPESAAAATALLAFTELYETVAREVFLTHARSVATALRKTSLDVAAMDNLPRDAWLMEALDRLFTFTRDASLKEPVGRLALAAVLDQSRFVAFADGYGAVADRPSALPAADRSRLLGIGARLLRDMGQTESADSLLADARPFVLFQMQTRITPPSAMYLPEPGRYLGLFRDHVLDIGFELRGQAAEILSMLSLVRALERLGRDTFPEDLAVQKSLAAARALVGRWPRYLTPALATSAAQATPGQTVEFRDAGSQTLTVRPRTGKDKAGNNEPLFVPVQPVKR
jgi:hypothetical protein